MPSSFSHEDDVYLSKFAHDLLRKEGTHRTMLIPERVLKALEFFSMGYLFDIPGKTYFSSFHLAYISCDLR